VLHSEASIVSDFSAVVLQTSALKLQLAHIQQQLESQSAKAERSTQETATAMAKAEAGNQALQRQVVQLQEALTARATDLTCAEKARDVSGQQLQYLSSEMERLADVSAPPMHINLDRTTHIA
jgi:DNA-binding transcriptional MerR regulator